jgi:hypothetical protein
MRRRLAHFISFIRRASTSLIVPKVSSAQCGEGFIAGAMGMIHVVGKTTW